MRRTAYAGLAAMVLAGTGGAAYADSGYLDISRSRLEVDSGGDTDITAVSGAGAFDLRGRMQFQMDLEIADVDTGSQSDTVVGGTLHLVTGADGWMFGGFAGGVSSEDDNLTVAGLEGALYFDRFTLAGAIAYGNSNDTDTDGIALLTQARYFIHRNLRVEATMNYGQIDVAGTDVDVFLLGAGGEFRLPNSPLSIFANYASIDSDDTAEEADRFSLGLRYNFDRDLAFRDESGASLVTAPRIADLF